jgi:SPP1 gp7 family putative phage head morphogenesis protein
MSRKIEERYVRAVVPLFDRFEKKAVAALEREARELAAPTVGLDLEWLRAYLARTIDETVIVPARGTQNELVKVAYRQGVTWADSALKTVSGGKVAAGPVDWRALDVLRARNASAMTRLAGDLNAGIIDGLTEGLLNGEGIPKLAARVQDACRAIGKTRAETIARTETMYAVNTGTITRYTQAGIEKVRYLAGLDERVCEECESKHGEVYEIADAPMLPLHPRCRCTFSPVIEVPK